VRALFIAAYGSVDRPNSIWVQKHPMTQNDLGVT
jgi:hypothetical protein